MSDQTSRRPPLSPVTLDELIADPSRANELKADALARMLAEIASRGAALTTLQGTLLSLVIARRDGNRDAMLADGLLDAPELARIFGVPESWIREQARQGHLPCLRLGHYMRFRLEEVERFLTERANHPD
jgi:excisionase family DNA binding protein